MLTRLKISGFKNLVDVDLRFGPFTCIAGANGAGKSNLFDAIAFLSALATKPLNQAALSIRHAENHSNNIRALFHQYGRGYAETISFEVEIRIPDKTELYLGKIIPLESQFLQYSLILAFQEVIEEQPGGGLVIIQETLTHPLNNRDPSLRTVFNYQNNSGNTIPNRTLLSTPFNATPPHMAAQREMQSWSTIQLEPSSMRRPSRFLDSIHIDTSGAFLASTLYKLEKQNVTRGKPPGQIYQRVANQLADLIDGIVGLDIERNDTAELLTLLVKDRTGTTHPARALSDGSLRFLAMAILEQDTQANRLLCLEEPENGIHPNKIPAMLELLTRMSVDLNVPIDPIDNPLRQVIISTQSPAVVCQVPDDSLLFAETGEVTLPNNQVTQGTTFRPMPDTWRAKYQQTPDPMTTGALMEFLHPVLPEPNPPTPFQRLVDRPEIKRLWRPVAEHEAK